MVPPLPTTLKKPHCAGNMYKYFSTNSNPFSVNKKFNLKSRLIFSILRCLKQTCMQHNIIKHIIPELMLINQVQKSEWFPPNSTCQPATVSSYISNSKMGEGSQQMAAVLLSAHCTVQNHETWHTEVKGCDGHDGILGRYQSSWEPW